MDRLAQQGRPVFQPGRLLPRGEHDARRSVVTEQGLEKVGPLRVAPSAVAPQEALHVVDHPEDRVLLQEALEHGHGTAAEQLRVVGVGDQLARVDVKLVFGGGEAVDQCGDDLVVLGRTLEKDRIREAAVLVLVG